MVYVMQIGIAFLGQETHDDYGHAKKDAAEWVNLLK